MWHTLGTSGCPLHCVEATLRSPFPSILGIAFPVFFFYVDTSASCMFLSFSLNFLFIWLIVPSSKKMMPGCLVQHYSGCFCVGVWGWNYTEISGLWVEPTTPHHNVGGPHPISRRWKTDLPSSKGEPCQRTAFRFHLQDELFWVFQIACLWTWTVILSGHLYHILNSPSLHDHVRQFLTLSLFLSIYTHPVDSVFPRNPD